MAFVDRIKYVIWDWNGTLLNDVGLCVDIMNQLLAKYRLTPISLKSYRLLFDFPVKDYYRKLGFDFKQIPFETVGQEFIDNYNRKRSRLSLQKGAVELLKFFEQKHIRQAIVSARKAKSLQEDLDLWDVSGFFDKVIGLDDDLARGKEHLTAELVESLKDIGIEPSEILFIGDTLHDCAIAKNNSGHFLAVANGHHSAARLLTCTDFVFANLETLKKFLLL